MSTIQEINQFLNKMSIGPDVNNQFGGISHNNVREWLKPIEFRKKFVFRSALEMSLHEYKEHVKSNVLNSIGIGIAYEILFIAFVLMCGGREEFVASFTLAASIYENILLAGFKPERAPVLNVIMKLEIPGYDNKELITQQLVEYFADTLTELGFDLGQNNFGLSCSELAEQYLRCCALRYLSRVKDQDQYIPEVVTELASSLVAYLPLITLVRKISKGNPDWDADTPIEIINMMVTDLEAHERFQSSTLRSFLNQVYSTYVRLCRLTKLSLRVKAAMESESDED